MKKFLLVLIFLIGLGFIGWKVNEKLQTAKGDKKGFGRKRFVVVETARVVRESISDIGFFSGSLYPMSSFMLAPNVAGKLKRLHFDIGDFVRKGELIAEIEDEELLQKLEQSEAELKIAQSKLNAVNSQYLTQIQKSKADESRYSASLNLAEKEYDRQVQLRKKNISSQSEIDKVHEQLLVAKAQLEVATKSRELLTIQRDTEKNTLEAELLRYSSLVKAAQLRLAYSKLTAEWFEGSEKRFIGERFVYEGELLKVGDPIVSILDLDTLIAVINATEKDYPRLQIGQEVFLESDAQKGKVFNGKIIRIAPLLNEASRVARIEIEVPNADHLLKPGMFVKIRINFKTTGNAVIIPITSLLNQEDKYYVFLADKANMKAVQTDLVIGTISGDKVEVVSPELTGEVITLGRHLVSNGSDIVFAEAEKKDKGEDNKGGKGKKGGVRK